MKNNLTGQVFGRLTALRPSGTKKWGCIAWECLCECGNTTEVASNTLRSGLTKSCGCLARDTARKNSRKHGHYGSRTYRIWGGIVQRCTNPNTRGYKTYGGAGVSICDRWRVFDNFLSDMGECPDGLTIDRINTLEGYSPENCRWASYVEQAHNKKLACTSFSEAERVRELRAITGMGPKALSKELGLPKGSIAGIIYLGNVSRER